SVCVLRTSCDHSPCLYCFFRRRPPSPFYSLSLHDALPISLWDCIGHCYCWRIYRRPATGKCTQSLVAAQSKRHNSRDGHCEANRSEEHTSELQSRFDLVCRLLLEKNKISHIMQFIIPYSEW